VTGKVRPGTITSMEAKPRMLDEVAHAGPEHLGPGFVAGFHRKQGYPDFPADASAEAGTDSEPKAAGDHAMTAPVPVLVITGPVGSGKSTIAVQVRHERIRSREASDPSWYLDAATHGAQILEQAEFEDHLVDNENRPAQAHLFGAHR
jgi:hypothetical protein